MSTAGPFRLAGFEIRNQSPDNIKFRVRTPFNSKGNVTFAESGLIREGQQGFIGSVEVMNPIFFQIAKATDNVFDPTTKWSEYAYIQKTADPSAQWSFVVGFRSPFYVGHRNYISAVQSKNVGTPVECGNGLFDNQQ